MADYTIYTAAVDGTTVTPTTPANGDTFVNDGNTVIVVYNGSGAGITFNVVTTQTVEGDLAVADRTESVANGATDVFGPFNTGIYGATVTLNTWSDTTSVTIYAMKVR